MVGTETSPETVEVRLLGTVEATKGGRTVPLGGRMQRTVLAALAAESGRRVSADRLIDIVWGEEATDGAKRSLQVYISNLRGLLDPDRQGLIASDGDGYALQGVETDVNRFEALSAADDVRSLRAALDLWRGAPLGGVVDDRLGAVGLVWGERHLATVEAWAAASVDAGDPAGPIGELERLLSEHPLRESLWEALITCLAASGRSAEALSAFGRVRDLLAAQGLEPSPSLRELEDRVLVEDEDLLAPREATTRLPEGIVTFLFLDIEGSTRLLHLLGDDYHVVLDGYRSAIGAATSGGSGHVISYDGDGAFLAFDSPGAALETAIEVLEAVHRATWPGNATVTVRAGIHSGLASPRGGDYVAIAVHQAARVVGAARGGQVIVTETTASFLPDQERLQPVGRFRLRDFDEPVRLHLAAVDADAAGRPIRALPADQHNLVRPLTATIGRESATTEVRELLGERSLVTLVGPGGVGKTRLAGDVAFRASEAWEGGSWKVSLAAVEDADQLGSTLAESLGIPASGMLDIENAIDYLKGRRCVIYLDNCEHLMEAVRPAVRRILSECPAVAVLATSREPLLLEGETVYRVEPLALPRRNATEPSPSCRLLEARAAAADKTFTIDDTNAAVAAELCHKLDGLPLLIELAAAQVAYLQLEEILAGVTDSLDSLEARGEVGEPRHRTADAVLDWGYALLSPRLQTAFRQLAMFGFSFTVDMARAALGDDAPTLIWDLLDRSILLDDRSAGATRYRMLRTVRLYGRRRAVAAGEAGPTAKRIADDLLRSAGPWLPADGQWVSTVGEEAENLRALIRPLAASGHDQLAQQVAVVLARHHNASQTFADGIEEIAGLTRRLTAPTPSRVALLAAEADLLLRTGEIEDAEHCVAAARKLETEVGQPSWDDVAVDRAAAELATRSGDLEAAVSIARDRLSRAITPRGRSRMYNILGIAAAASDDLGSAYDAFVEELAASVEAGADPWIVSAHGNLAEAAYLRGDLAAAARHQATSLRLALEEGWPAGVAFSFITAARLAQLSGDPETALRLQLAADRMLDDLGLALFPEDASAADDLRDSARASLGPDRSDEVAAGAETMDPSEVASLAMAVLEEAAH